MDDKDYGIGAQILHDIEITKLKVLSNATSFRKRVGMTGYGIEIIEYINYYTQIKYYCNEKKCNRMALLYCCNYLL